MMIRSDNYNLLREKGSLHKGLFQLPFLPFRDPDVKHAAKPV